MGKHNAQTRSLAILNVWLLLSIPILSGPLVLAGETNLPLASSKFLGAQSCSTSGCHGGAGELNRQFTLWTQYDFHHQRPVATLTTARSERLANILKIADPTKDARCTACHAPFQTVPAALLDPMVKITEGVSCESCHGPAEKWLLSHTRKDYSHADRVHSGMRELKNPYVRANTCVACHQNVDNDLLRAGHPELIFELDGQAVTQPRHWRKELERPGPQLWAVGQAVALREILWHPAQEQVPHSALLDRTIGLLWVVDKVRAAIEGKPARSFEHIESQVFVVEATKQLGDSQAREITDLVWTPEMTRKTLKEFMNSSAEFTDEQISRKVRARMAERLVLALDRLTQALPETKTDAINESLNRLFTGAQSLPDFDPNQFAKDLKEFHARVASALESK